ncbi:MAG TPA: GntR family transcriptional regulator [Paracoccus sp. (in: a-proteobacteria)]|uniref:GntR family transcriptional regulator n=1 Tax=Paracoccus sp. TaxID=267 RepID=UPI002CC04BB8|nr:GntR family transcriptional regulator [Paracoccus sp. (in: a-proteobacteria)]HWL57714.1 GntR family transcriptional regulator [Paracoccus sp. (in: a-proteobacteria)]
MASDSDGQEGRERDAGNAFLYASVRDLLAAKIRAGQLPEGAVLKEAPISSQLGMSRAPVRRALAMLAAEGLVTPASGQGYVAGRSGAPLRLSSRRLQEILTSETQGIERTASWERIFTQVADVVTGCMPFGTFRIQEAELGDYYSVSRTVAREVLWRLMDRRLIEKNRKSHWIVGQMTARDLRDTLQMRRLLEPEALALVAADRSHRELGPLLAKIEAVIEGFPACGAAVLDRLDDAMFVDMFAGVRNSRLLGSIRRNQLFLLVPRLFRRHFPIIDDLQALKEYAEILRHLQQGQVRQAQDVLRDHLSRIEALALARLRVLSLLEAPGMTPYMTPVYRGHDG